MSVFKTRIGFDVFFLQQDRISERFYLEIPHTDLIYRGVAYLINGTADVDIDSSSGMTEGTFAVLTENPQIFLSNHETKDYVRIADKKDLLTGKFKIISPGSNANTEVDWMVVAKRKDINLSVEESILLSGL